MFLRRFILSKVLHYFNKFTYIPHPSWVRTWSIIPALCVFKQNYSYRFSFLASEPYLTPISSYSLINNRNIVLHQQGIEKKDNSFIIPTLSISSNSWLTFSIGHKTWHNVTASYRSTSVGLERRSAGARKNYHFM